MEITPHLGLVVDDNLTNTAKQNLRKIDVLAGKLNILDDSTLLLDSNNEIILSPSTTLAVGQADGRVTQFNIFADEINIDGTTTINGLVYDYVALNFSGSSLTSIEDYDIVISANADVVTALAHTVLTDNPHNTTAAQVGAYTTSQTDSLLDLKSDDSTVQAHISDLSNPHEVTASQIDAYTIAQVDVLIASTASDADLSAHVDNESNPHNVTAEQVNAYNKPEIDALLSVKAAEIDLTNHTGDTDNPHSTTAAQVGAYTTSEVNDLLDDKADESVVTAHIGDTDNPHSVTAEQIGAEPTLTKGDITASVGGLSVTGGTWAVIGAGVEISQTAASASTDGYLTKEDWSTFAAGGGGGYSTLIATLSGTDISNGYVSLPSSPLVPTDTQVAVRGGPSQAYGLTFDFTVSGANVIFSNADIWSMGPNLEAGDVLTIMYH
jgi:hypothetical protein